MKRTITGGVYLVVDPALGLDVLLPTIEKAIQGGIDVLQIWNNWQDQPGKQQVVIALCRLAHRYNLPVIINEEWELLLTTPADGVHFDTVPADFNSIKQRIGKTFLCGITCGNDLNRISWADANGLSYISFCSMFPSPSAGVCEIVQKHTVQQARQLTSLPIFVSGGITLENVKDLRGTGMNGIALISAILKADDPKRATQAFKNSLKTMTHEAITP